MKSKSFILLFAAIALMSCKQPYTLTRVTGTIVAIDSTFDTANGSKMEILVNKYKTKLDREMQQVIGTSSRLMDYGRPESLLTNLTSDVMKAYGDEHLPNGVDVAVMNVYGHRANLPQSSLTVGNLYETYSFDNTITFLDLKGSELQKIFESYARLGGAGISGNVKLRIKDKKLVSATVSGKPVDNHKTYKIATLDYLADGNDGMSAFRNSENISNTGITLREVMINYVKDQTRKGYEITSELDGRIEVVK